MGKLNIAHHKSYHPYRRDNIERVRRDEEEARLTEAKEEGRMMLAVRPTNNRTHTIIDFVGLRSPNGRFASTSWLRRTRQENPQAI